MGYQLSAYSIYRYRKIKNDRLPLNRILLSMGSFLFLANTCAFLFSFNRLNPVDPAIQDIIYRIGYVMILIGPILFLYFITIKGYSMVLNLRLSKVLMALEIIPIILAIVLPSTQSLAFRGGLVFTVVIAIYILIFQVRLIHVSIGQIKNRLKYFFIGEMFCFLGMFSAAELVMDMLATFLPETLIHLFTLMGIISLILGYTIVFVSVYNFPENAFYEMEWKKSLLKLFIIDVKNNIGLFNCTFSDVLTGDGLGEKRVDGVDRDIMSEGDALFSGGLIGIESIISEVTKNIDKKISKIDRGNSYILIEHGTEKYFPIIYALVVKEDLDSLVFFVKKIKEQFESFYGRLLLKIEGTPVQREHLFNNFEIMLKNIL
jgi:hypothetical protein